VTDVTKSGSLRSAGMAKLSDEQLLDLARPLALGALAGGFAHRATNDLFAVAGLAELLLEDVDDDWPGRRQLSQIHGSARKLQRASRLLSDLRNPSGPAIVELAHVCRHAIDLVRMTKLSETVEIVENYAEAATFEGNPDMLVIALVHLIRNAEESVADRGRITIETGTNDGFVYVRVENDGPALEPDAGESIFEPFVSTKEGHAGLGLATARAAVHSLGGEITIAPIGSCCFELRLPAVGD
jgi:two-component system sensor histidine kinase HydH